MVRPKTYIRLIATIAILLASTGCSQLLQQLLRTDANYYMRVHVHNIDPGDFEAATESIEGALSKNSARGQPEGFNEGRAYLQLSHLYSCYRNPTSDYARALELLEKYVSMSNGKSIAPVIQDRLSLLYTLVNLQSHNHHLLEEYEAVFEKNKVLSKKLKKLKPLRNEVTRIREENTRMKEMLEELKDLDIKIEEQRRTIR